MPTDQPAGRANELVDAPLIYPHWAALFFLAGGALVVITGALVWMVTGLSAQSDQVFAVEALVAGLGVDIILRHFFRRRLVIAPKLNIPLTFLWPLLCMYVFIFQPLSG